MRSWTKSRPRAGVHVRQSKKAQGLSHYFLCRVPDPSDDAGNCSCAGPECYSVRECPYPTSHTRASRNAGHQAEPDATNWPYERRRERPGQEHFACRAACPKPISAWPIPPIASISRPNLAASRSSRGHRDCQATSGLTRSSLPGPRSALPSLISRSGNVTKLRARM